MDYFDFSKKQLFQYEIDDKKKTKNEMIIFKNDHLKKSFLKKIFFIKQLFFIKFVVSLTIVFENDETP